MLGRAGHSKVRFEKLAGRMWRMGWNLGSRSHRRVKEAAQGSRRKEEWALN
jgi:hypothetical protein